MSAAWAVIPAVLAAACVGRAWNTDETERITSVMARDAAAFDPGTGIPMHDMPRLAPSYGPPVYVRDERSEQRRAKVRARLPPRAPRSAVEEAQELALKLQRERQKQARDERSHHATRK